MCIRDRFVIVLDSLGIGAMPDSKKFGDEGVDTFGHILEKMGTLEMCIRDRLPNAGLDKLFANNEFVTIGLVLSVVMAIVVWVILEKTWPSAGFYSQNSLWDSLKTLTEKPSKTVNDTPRKASNSPKRLPTNRPSC